MTIVYTTIFGDRLALLPELWTHYAQGLLPWPVAVVVEAAGPSFTEGHDVTGTPRFGDAEC